MLLTCFLFIIWLPRNWAGLRKWLSRTNGLKLFGPVFFYDMIRTARRRRHTVLRLGYAFLLVYVLAIIYLVTVEERVLKAKEDLSNQLISESGLRELTLR